jgi:hypothetical protein
MRSTHSLTVRAGRARCAPFLLLVGVVLLSACGGSKPLSPGYPSEYPSWFLEQPPAFAVGYARNGGYEDAAVREAARVAAKAFAMEESVIVNGGRGSIVGPFGTVLAGPILEEFVDYDRVDHYYDPERVAAAAHLDRMTVVLLAKRTLSDAEKGAIDDDLRPSGGSYPDWVEHPPDDDEDGYTYAVGLSGKNEYEVTSWRMAERHARFRFALNTLVDVSALYREGGIALVEADNVVVRGFEVVKRWRDPEDGACFVLARAGR